MCRCAHCHNVPQIATCRAVPICAVPRHNVPSNAMCRITSQCAAPRPRVPFYGTCRFLPCAAQGPKVPPRATLCRFAPNAAPCRANARQYQGYRLPATIWLPATRATGRRAPMLLLVRGLAPIGHSWRVLFGVAPIGRLKRDQPAGQPAVSTGQRVDRHPVVWGYGPGIQWARHPVGVWCGVAISMAPAVGMATSRSWLPGGISIHLWLPVHR